MVDRIWFLKNPWPEGHAIALKRWSGRLDVERGLVFDFDVASAKYRAERDAPDGDESDWNSPSVWNNYHACSLSSVKWGDAGFVVGKKKKPFDWSALDGKTYRVEKATTELPDPNAPRAFGIYLLGHDGVADHSLSFAKTEPGWSVSWKAKIALAYKGDFELKHRMKAELSGLEFEGFKLPRDLKPEAAQALFETLVTDPKEWVLEPRVGFVRSAKR